MDQKTITRAAKVIASKTDYVGGGNEGYVALGLIDEDGYPTASAITISKAEGIKWLTFLTGLNSNKVKRIGKCNKGCVCLCSPEYNITLVGTLEVLTDPDFKKEMWQEPLGAHFSGWDDPNYCVLRFNTERYNLHFTDDYSGATGTI